MTCSRNPHRLPADALNLEMKDFPYPRNHHGEWFLIPYPSKRELILLSFIGLLGLLQSPYGKVPISEARPLHLS